MSEKLWTFSVNGISENFRPTNQIQDTIEFIQVYNLMCLEREFSFIINFMICTSPNSYWLIVREPDIWNVKVWDWFLIGFSSCLEYFDECVTLSRSIFIIWRRGDFLWSDSNTHTRHPIMYWTMKLLGVQAGWNLFYLNISVSYTF